MTRSRLVRVERRSAGAGARASRTRRRDVWFSSYRELARRCARLLVAASSALVAASCGRGGEVAPVEVARWYRGNLHAHTTRCDHADSSPEEVVRWYHDHGYDFLCLSEHDLFIDPSELALDWVPRAGFFLIRGAELNYPHIVYPLINHVRMNSLGGTGFEGKTSAPNRAGQLQDFVRDIQLGGGLPVLNHPTYLRCIATEDVLPIEGLHFFEVYNGAWQAVWPGGDGEHPSCEQLWDQWLSAGKVLYGLATDNAHRYDPGRDNQTPGRGWVMVRAAEPTPRAVLDSLLEGEFYSSTGVMLSRLQRGPGEYVIVVDEAATASEVRGGLLAPRVFPAGTPGTRIEFTGPRGELLHAVDGSSASFVLSPAHAYVRCTVVHSWTVAGGIARCHAWAQPVFTDGRRLPQRR